MKKVSKKNLVPASETAHVDDITDTVAPKWFAPAMQTQMREILKDYPTKDEMSRILNERLSGFATKEDLKNHPTNDDLRDMSEHLTKIFLDRFDEQDNKFFELFEKNARGIGNHETRIISLERRLT